MSPEIQFYLSPYLLEIVGGIARKKRGGNDSEFICSLKPAGADGDEFHRLNWNRNSKAKTAMHCLASRREMERKTQGFE
jgi:hypothetical protein